MRHTSRLAALALTAMTLLAGCIINDIPYPRIQPNFTAFEVKGQDQGTLIDSAQRLVTVYLPEETDPFALAIDTFALSAGATIVGNTLDSTIDLSKTLFCTLHLYQDWVWRIKAEQPIERYFTVQNQVGPAEIDVPGRRVVAYVTKSTDIKRVVIESMKLGPAGSTYDPVLPGKPTDFTHPVEVQVTQWGRNYLWTIYVEVTDQDVATERVDAWTRVAWVYGRGEAGQENGVEYRLQGDDQWTRLDAGDITSDGGSFMGRICHLEPETTYEARVYSGTLTGTIVSFTTGTEVQVPNTDLDQWWLDGKVWCPWPEGGEQWWDTGNKGAATLGQSNSMPTDDTSSGTGWAAKLETRFVGIGKLGKLAAGNIFAGRYVRTDGTNGVLALGRPFTMRPTRLRGYFKYNCAPINYVSDELSSLEGQPDTCAVWAALIDTPEPFEIRTNPKNRQLFDPAGSYVVAYGRMQMGETVSQYTPFEFELEYTSTSRVPTYIIITASASKYGDYFTGGAGSVLFVDDLKLEYDY